jgi:hypothetical protein
MEDQHTQKSPLKGYLFIILALAGWFLVCKPFAKYDEKTEELTNASWLLVGVITIVYWLVVVNLFGQKKH